MQLNSWKFSYVKENSFNNQHVGLIYYEIGSLQYFKPFKESDYRNSLTIFNVPL
jgi:hypothetical protein